MAWVVLTISVPRMPDRLSLRLAGCVAEPIHERHVRRMQDLGMRRCLHRPVEQLTQERAVRRLAIAERAPAPKLEHLQRDFPELYRGS
jgi:hypothetical protein